MQPNSKEKIALWFKQRHQQILPHLALFFMIVICPFLFTTTSSWSPFENVKIYWSIFVFTAIIILQMLFKFKKNLVIETNIWIYALTAFIASMFLSSVFSIDPLFSFMGSDQLPTGSFMSYFVVFVYVLFFYCNRQFIKRKLVIKLFAISGFALSLYGVFQHFGVDFYDWWGYKEFHLRVFTTIGNPIQYGMMVGTISFLLLYKFLTAKDLRFVILNLIMWMTSVLATLYSGSRAPVLLQAGLFATVLIYLAAYLKTEKLLKLKCFLGVLLFVGAHYFYFLENRNNAVAERLAPKAFSIGLKIRTTVWQTGLKSGLDHPFLGTGPELFFISYYKHKPAFHNMYQTWSETMNKAHNEFVQIWVTQGALGLLTLGFVFFLFFRRSLAAILTRNHTDDQLIEFFIMIAVIYLILNNIFVFNLFPTLFLMIMLMTLTFWNEKSSSITIEKLSLSQLARVTIAIFWIGLIANAVPFWRGNDLYSRAVYLKKTPQIYEALSAIRQAIEINPTRTYYNCNYAELLIQSYLIQKEVSKVNYPAFLSELKTIADLCLNSQPYNFFTWHQVAFNYLKLAEQDKSLLDYSIESFNRALKLHPNTPLLYVELGFAYELKGDYAKSFENFDKSIEQKSDFLEAYFRKLLPLYQLKRTDDIKNTVDAITKVDWENSTYKSIGMFLNALILLASDNTDLYSEMQLRLLRSKLVAKGVIN